MKLWELTSDWVLVEHYLTESKKIEYLASQKGAEVLAAANNDTSAPNRSPEMDEMEAAQMLIGELLKGDPTNGKALQFLVNNYVGGNFKFEDLDIIKQNLELFKKVSPQLDANQRDINRYSLKELREILKGFQEKEAEDLMSKREKKGRGGSSRREFDTLISEGNFHVFVPRTMAASCSLGRNTHWCTASDPETTQNRFKQYSEDGDLYTIWLGSTDNPERKFQLHYEGNEFMDEDNDQVSSSDIELLSSYPAYAKFLNFLIEKHYSEYFNS